MEARDWLSCGCGLRHVPDLPAPSGKCQLELWWHHNWQGKTVVADKDLPQCHSVLHTSHTDSLIYRSDKSRRLDLYPLNYVVCYCYQVIFVEVWVYVALYYFVPSVFYNGRRENTITCVTVQIFLFQHFVFLLFSLFIIMSWDSICFLVLSSF